MAEAEIKSEGGKKAKYVVADRAAKFLEVTPWEFSQIVASGSVTVRQYPNLKPKYLVDDLERLRKASVRQAIAM
jgi:hypothetical protein